LDKNQFVMIRKKNVRLDVAGKLKTKQVQRYLIAGTVFSIFGFFCALLYWNLGINSDAKAGVAYTWNGSADSLWSNAANWTPTGVPVLADDITIPSTSRNPVLNATVNVNGLILSANAQIDFNGFDVTVANSFTSNAGNVIQLRGKKLTLNGSANILGGTFNENTFGAEVIISGPNTVFGNSSGGPVINSILTVNTARLSIRNSIFNGVSSFTKNNVGNDACTGNNIFNAATSISNTSTSYIVFSNSTRDIYNGTVTLNTTNSGPIYMAYNGVNTQFNDDVKVNSSGAGGVRFGTSNGTASVASGKTITTGSLGFSNGILQLRNLTFDGAADQNFQLTGTGILQLGPATTFNGNVTSVSPGLSLNGAIFNSRFTAERNGAASNSGTGGNVFNGITQITNSGTGYILLSNSAADIFNAEVTFTSINSGAIHVAYAGTGNAFNQNVYVNSTSSGGVRFGTSGGTSTLAAGKDISIGTQGFSGGPLQFSGFSFGDASPKSFVLGSSATLTFGPNTEFDGDVNSSSGGLYLSGAVFNRKLNAVKTGATNDQGIGGNVYHDSVSLRNEGTGYLLLSNSSNDIFNSHSKFSSTGTGIIYVAHRGTNTQFNGNIEVNSTSSGGVRFSSSTGSSTLAVGRTISVGPEGFIGGNLIIGRVNLLGNTTQNLNLGAASLATLGPDINIESKLNVVAGGILLNGGTFADDVTFVKNGSSNENGAGGCTFNASLSVTNNGTGYFLSSNSSNDVYHGKVTANNTSSGIIYLAHRGVNTQFNSDIELKSSGNGSIRIGAATGTSVLADGKNIITDSSSFTSGYLAIARMTLGSNPQSFTMGVAATINLGPALTMNGTWDFTGGGIRLSNCYFDKAVNLVKTGTMNDDNGGDNTFMKPLSITNNNSGFFLFARNSKDVFNDDVIVNCNNSGLIYMAYNDSATVYNGNIIVSSVGSAGIRFCGGNGVAQLASGKSISIGTAGFTAGELNFRRFKQMGNTPLNFIATSGNASLVFNNGSIFNGTVNANFPQLLLNGTVFNAPVSIEKNGAGSNTSSGGNVFNGNATIINSSTSSFTLANSSSDDFNANVIFTQNNSGALYPAYNSACTFAGDITVNGTSASLIMANMGSGKVVLDGNALQNINGLTTLALTIRRLEMINTGDGLQLNIPVSVSNALILNDGVIKTVTSNKLSLGTSVTSVAGVSDASYVEGPVEKIGNAAFTFPTGMGGLYRPIGMTAPVAATDRFTAEYFTANPNPSYPIASKESSLYAVSRCEYWSFVRNAGTANVRMVMSWRDPVSCEITNINDLRVARWDTTAAQWKDLGNGSVTGNTTAGTVTSNLGAAPYSIFALGSSSAANSLPVELISFSAVKDGNTALLKWATASEKNNDYFTLEKSQNNFAFVEVGRVNGYGNSTTKREYQFIDDHPFNGTSYYRLRQTDFNGEFEVFQPVMLNFEGELEEFKISSVAPNPFVNELRVNVFSPSGMNAEIIIYNSMGNTSYRQQIALNSGSNGIDISMDSDLPPGIYFLKLSTADKSTEPFKLIRK
jgi:Secretion system C-terminal sorting domain